LAYLFDPESAVIVAEQRRLRAERRERLHKMAIQMAGDGFPIDPDELLAGLPESSSAGRPHLAVALQRAGLVSSVAEAFDRYLANGGPYYLPKTDTPVRIAIDMINAAGGVTVFAHAFAKTRGRIVTPEVIADLAVAGLAGIEVDHPDHDQAARDQLRGLATELGLPITGSSDYHGANKIVKIGQETTAPEMFEALVARASGVALLRSA
jgi:predicted metal-dependent phosphoesterase TrpH